MWYMIMYAPKAPAFGMDSAYSSFKLLGVSRMRMSRAQSKWPSSSDR